MNLKKVLAGIFSFIPLTVLVACASGGISNNTITAQATTTAETPTTTTIETTTTTPTTTTTTTQETFVVTFNTNGGGNITSQNVVSGGKVTRPTNPTKEKTSQYTYTFAGWYKDSAFTQEFDFDSAITSRTTIYAKWNQTVNKYSVTWKNYDDSELEKDTDVEYGATPSYDGQTPTKATDNALAYTYSFDKWTPNVIDVVGDAIYTAVFKQDFIDYTVSFVNDDDTPISSDTYHYGDTVTVPNNPTKQSTVSKTYTFAGWDSQVTTVDGNKTYKATYTEAPRVYTVKWNNEDGTKFHDDTQWTYSATNPTLDVNPTKASTAQYDYTFSGWTYERSSDEGRITATAQFTPVLRKYTITWKNGTATLETDADVPYGTTPEYNGATPTKPEDAEYTYTFKGWDPEISSVTGNQEYTAQFNAVSKSTPISTYTITWKDGDGITLTTTQVNAGDTPTYSGTTPTKTATAQYTYTFNNGWEPSIVAATADATYTATFDSTVRQYTITWDYANGNSPKTEKVNYGTTPAYVGAEPTKAETAEYTYSFEGWSSDNGITIITNPTDFPTIEGDIKYIAIYDRTVKYYTITWLNYDGDEITDETYAYGATPSYDITPSRPNDAQYTYTFSGWTPAITKVTGDASYTATYTETLRKYTITWKNDDNTTIDTTTVNYGTVPTHADPAKTGYTFSGWTPTITAVTGAATYTATFTQVDSNAISTNTAYSFTGSASQSGDIVFTGGGEGKAPFTESKLTVDTSSGKFVSNGSGWYQINAGTILTFSTTQAVKVTITMYGNGHTSGLYTISGTGLSSTSNSEVVQSFNTTGSGTVTITSTINDYIGRLEIELLDTSVTAESIEVVYVKTAKSTNTSYGNGTYKTVNAKTVYKVGESFDYSGIYGVVTYSNSTSEVILGSGLTFTGFNSSTAGTKTITVSYTAGGKTVSSTYNVYVVSTEPSIVNDVLQVKVDKNYSGTIGAVTGNYNMFKTISQALDFLRNYNSTYSTNEKLLYVEAGKYNEKLWIDIPNLTIRGANKLTTIIEYDSLYYNSSYANVTGYKERSIDPDGFEHVTDSTQTMTIAESATNCTLYDITVSNYWNSYNAFYGAFNTNSIEHRALALLIYADKVVVQECRLLGYQDTLEVMSGRSYFYESYISGATDFIFGTNPTILFEKCEIRSIYNGSTDGGYINAFKGINKDASDYKEYGVIYDDCDFTKDDSVTSSNTSIARPWDYYSNVVTMNSTLDAHISKTAYTSGTTKNQRYVCWTNNGAVAAQPTSHNVHFYEYNNDGTGALSSAINGMTMISSSDAANYKNIATIYGTLNGYSSAWTPELVTEGPVANTITETDSKGYTEGAYVEFDTTASSVNAYIKKSTASSYDSDPVASDLVRISGGKGRVDVVGLTTGDSNSCEYDIKLVDASDSTIVLEVKNLVVVKDDRSGYAHFNYNSGVGAYNDDGTLKSNAKVIYVTDENKNSIEYDGCKGLVAILQGEHSVPLDIRIIGSIKTTQWNQVTYTETAKTVALYEKQSERLGGTGKTGKVYASTILDSNNNWNSYSDDIALGITELKGLTSYASCSLKDSGKSSEHYEWDSYWNMCNISGRSNITIEGIGIDATIFQWGLTFDKCNSIEVKNLTFDDYTEDAIGIQGDDGNVSKYANFWIHNCTFEEGVNRWDISYEKDKSDGDGSTDFKYARNLTISYCRYNGTHKTNLIGGNNANLQYNITLHHNYYNGCKSRLPLVRQANIHMYNNYYKDTTDTGISVRAKAYAFIENCYFDGKNPYMLAYETKNSVDPVGTAIKAVGNEFSSTTTAVNDSTSGVSYMANGIYVLTATNPTVNISPATRTTTVTGSTCTPDGTHSYANFDTDDTLFYYTGSASDVTRMDDASDLPDLIPTIAGAGVCGGSFTGGSTNSGSGSGSSTDPQTATKHVFNFEDNNLVDELGYFTVSGDGASIKQNISSVVYDETTYTKAIKLDSKPTISFTTTATAKLTIVALNSETIKVDGLAKTPDSNNIIEVSNLSAGEHTIVRGSAENSIYLIIVEE